MMLLCLAGTIRVVFAGNAYNIPVAIWVPLLYPAQPPFVHVMPTPTMLIKPSKHVDVNGKVYHPFLAFWHTRPDGGGSSLGSNGFTLPISISPSPGLPSLSTPRIPTGRISPQPGGGSSGASSGVNGAGGGLAHQGIAHNPVWNAAGSSVGPATSGTVTPPPLMPKRPAALQDEATVRRNAVRNRLNQRLRQVSDAVARDMDRLAQINKTLKERERHIAGMHAFLLDAEKRLQAEVEELEARCNEVRESIAKIKEEPDVDVETFIVAATPRDNQLLELVAEDHAIDDTIYQLNKGLGSSHLQHNVTSFLKNVRALAREQFMKRALIKTIRETARQEGQ
nr:hypothetical protein HK105_005514 [Polyrhizophydium stewartii]